MRENPVPLILVTTAAATAGWADTAEPVARYLWDTEIIEGVSGLELDETGTVFTAIGDRGFWMTGRLVRTGGGIVEVAVDTLAPILGPEGFPVAARRVGDWSDSEGLAIAPDGTVWVSFERWAHVWRYDQGLGGPASHIKDHPTFYDHAENWQLEATAISPEGDVYTFSEKPLPNGFPIYRLSSGGWVIDGTLPENDLFSIVGADFDENGDLYLLERKLVMGFWWQSRLRRVRLDGSEDRVLWTSQRGDFGNLEGLALWRDGDTLMMTAVSDNNGDLNTPTEWVDFRLTPAPPEPIDAESPEG
ncbi:esterase-like activity of phytase family protein [Alphaproteobacteria bacterium GH1-50]|uniref:Esterase-like activity of phytase family protein n=1 Tax=Kangsaoukella pontilimi TaxID=2691042 RepID=A0A7C9IGH9_9RHOB|nr:esterase-like activity of phytase family protein [Kangsaoukella pontilimi]MXQ08328.1 esterase-like activity of phytase family protein [Kangsaoukella pontilimi]